ncbi:hypothetical protein DFP72DRAFT_822055 [Ephemerocybe angulata]|uniref:Reverse transcriptase domain-containing protein n=1 Tax=Ephemerocybe angulata TaxID=980116 RepID=A0A8H6HIB4_9AGAR|nr:hypothetical protein DFP72DRAFT_830279 [Tulosesus angulatus]KAF6747299.1 hypothetical protein DFP72DRAFT_822055 [Tulosesus angulatus]
MSYIVRHQSEMSEAFSALMGILAGDTSSPILWLIYLSDFILDADVDDINLSGIPMSNMEQADDIILMSTTPEGLQRKMHALWRWCGVNAMVVNAIKSMVMIFGPHPRLQPSFAFGTEHVAIVDETTYVGFRITSHGRSIFAPHYALKAGKAQTIANGILGLHKMIGSLNPWEARKLYMALVDPHLTHGCEMIIDTPENLQFLKLLEDKQKSFIRRILGIHSRSMLAPLFSETAIIPLRYRRVLLALMYLLYLLKSPPDHLVKSALLDSTALLMAGKPCWLGDLLHALQKLPTPVYVHNPHSLTTEDIGEVMNKVQRSMQDDIMRAINSSEGLYLLRNRLEPPENVGEPPQIVAIKFRHYLSVPSLKHRVALTKLLTASHELAVERLKWARTPTGERVDLPRDRRLCRFCHLHAESPEHALLECKGNLDLVQLRHIFWQKMRLELPQLPLETSGLASLVDGLKWIIANRPTIRLVAKFAYQVLSLYSLAPIYIPPLEV